MKKDAIQRIDKKQKVTKTTRRKFLKKAAVVSAGAVVAPAHGVLITSATLRDGSGDVEADWASAEARTGARHLPEAIRATVPSPPRAQGGGAGWGTTRRRT